MTVSLCLNAGGDSPSHQGDGGGETHCPQIPEMASEHLLLVPRASWFLDQTCEGVCEAIGRSALLPMLCWSPAPSFGPGLERSLGFPRL